MLFSAITPLEGNSVLYKSIQHNITIRIQTPTQDTYRHTCFKQIHNGMIDANTRDGPHPQIQIDKPKGSAIQTHHITKYLISETEL